MLHQQLAKWLPNMWIETFSALYLINCLGLGHSITCPSGHGIPNGIKQQIELNAKRAEAMKGTKMTAQLMICKDCPNLLAVCVYDNEPIHLLSICQRALNG